MMFGRFGRRAMVSSSVILPYNCYRHGIERTLTDPPGFPPLPPPSSTVPGGATATGAVETGLPLDNIQSDILLVLFHLIYSILTSHRIGMRKKKELFFFFGIENAVNFKAKLKWDILPLVTSVRKLLDDEIHEKNLTIALNIAFSQAGLNKLNIRESDLNDALFKNGQFQDAANLGDDPKTWLSEFKNNGTQRIHGVILLASNTTEMINGTLKNLKTTLGDSITEIHSLQGAARPDDEEGHEREFFSFLFVSS
jgi:hypothetical protein